MDYDLETLDVPVTGMQCDACARRVHAAVSALPGVDAVDARVGHLHVAYYPLAVSVEGIFAAVRELGYGIDRGDHPEGFLDRISRTNQELFGNRRLECCTLNRPHPGATREGRS